MQDVEEEHLAGAGAGSRRDLPLPVVPAQDKAQPARKKPRFPGLSVSGGRGSNPRPSAGKRTQRRMDRAFALNHAKTYPLETAGIRTAS
jgi:hypothetical protein